MTPSEEYLDGYEAALRDLDHGNANPHDVFPVARNNYQKGWNDCMAKCRLDNGTIEEATRINWRAVAAMTASGTISLIALWYVLVLWFSL